MEEEFDVTDCVVIDIETTGLNPSYAKIVEIGAVRVYGLQIMSRFQTLVWPGMDAFKVPGASDALKIQRKRVADFEGAPTIDEVAPLLKDFVGNRPVTAFNSYFEQGFLGDLLDHEHDFTFCVMKHSAWIMGKAGSRYCPWNDYHHNYKWPKLPQAAEFFDVEFDSESGHTALYDTEIAARILIEMERRRD